MADSTRYCFQIRSLLYANRNPHNRQEGHRKQQETIKRKQRKPPLDISKERKENFNLLSFLLPVIVSHMKIVADENIPYVQEVFRSLGPICCVPGRSIHRDLLCDTDILLVRSVTPVDADLLEHTHVRFVGTATIGTDHINRDYLRDHQIAFADAAGSNANSVAEYIITAILVLAQRKGWNLQNKTLGIVGLGNIGSRVETMAQALGMNILANDPPRQRLTGDPRFVELTKILEADFITLHVPLTHSGPDPTHHLFDETILQQLSPQTVLINTSRGAVVDTPALHAQLEADALGPTVLDVWEEEPNINLDLLARIDIATPHIAGYSLDGKANGTIMLYDRVCRFLGLAPQVDIQTLLPAPAIPDLTFIITKQTHQEILTQAVTAIYDILRDDSKLRQIRNQPPDVRGTYFDQLRKDYPVRREAHNTRVSLSPANPSLAETLGRLGFQCK